MAILPATTNPLKVKKPGDPTTDEDLSNSAMGSLVAGLNSPSAGTQAQIDRGTQAVAQFARNAQQTGAAAVAARGGIGQGTANSYAQAERQSVMGQLAQNEQNNTKLVSDEHKAFLDKALDVSQQNKTLAQNQSQFESSQAQSGSQFDRNLEQNASQFKSTYGLQYDQLAAQRTQFTETLNQSKAELVARTSSNGLQTLAALGQNIPTVAAKVMNLVLGQQGIPLTSVEKADLMTWYDQQQASGAKMDAQMETILQSILGTPSAMGAISNPATPKPVVPAPKPAIAPAPTKKPGMAEALL